MAITANLPLNEAKDVETFGALATFVAANLTGIAAAAITGEQKLNSVKNEITVARLIAHYKARAGAGGLPAASGLLASDKINSTKDTLTLDHVVRYFIEQGISVSVPVNSVAPVITGSGNGPFTVSNNGTWSNSPDSFTYQWYRGATPVAGATTNTLASNAANVGQSITCRVSGVNEAGAGTAVASNAIVGA